MKTIILTGNDDKINKLRKELELRLKRDKVVCKDETLSEALIEVEKKIIKKAGRPRK